MINIFAYIEFLFGDSPFELTNLLVLECSISIDQCSISIDLVSHLSVLHGMDLRSLKDISYHGFG